jgi:hypothetical protein
MTKEMNPNSLLFLYEGETEAEFYKKIFTHYVPPRKIRRNYGNLKGVYNLNEKVISKIELYLNDSSSESCNNIHVFVAYDRDGPREKETSLDINCLRKEFIYKGSRISSINEIVATQDLESWFFHDLEGIYKFLKVPKAQRNLGAYNNVEATNNRKLSALFHRFGNHYQKGKRVHGFLDSLNIGKIHNNVQELQEAIIVITNLC